jgi:hypothetical protein
MAKHRSTSRLQASRFGILQQQDSVQLPSSSVGKTQHCCRAATLINRIVFWWPIPDASNRLHGLNNAHFLRE